MVVAKKLQENHPSASVMALIYAIVAIKNILDANGKVCNWL